MCDPSEDVTPYRAVDVFLSEPILTGPLRLNPILFQILAQSKG